ncbi:MAG TPA: VOC family protein [Acidimicrobiales bacterium]|jgi:uncharacterized glyoxalase superfamily protein PhnB|nr:VOC family protein [Acidimicrobiales bacterium]
MPDPFESLREPIAPIAPRPQFVNQLRDRLAAALGVEAEPTEQQELREYTPARLHSVTPYLACKGADRAIEWYQEVFGASLLGDPVIMPDGHVGHAELRIGDTVFMLADEFAEERHLGPDTLGGSSVALMVHVPDSDRTCRLAVSSGAELLRPVTVQYGARSGVIRDPFGHRWFVATAIEPDDVPVEDVPGRRFGDIGYMTLEVPDGDRARRFYSELFGWETRGGYQPGSFHVSSITPPSGIHGREGAPEFRLYFRVDDIEATANRVRELGGEVLTINQYESGGNAECVDDQGLRFDLFRPRPGY